MKQTPLYLFIALVLFISGCGDETNNITQIKSQLIISPEELLINDNETGKIFLSVQPDNEFEWNITEKPDWLEIEPSSGKVSGEIVELVVTPNKIGLNEGNHIGRIEILTNGAGKAQMMVGLRVEAYPNIEVTPTAIDFSTDKEQEVINIKNTGSGYLHWNIEFDIPWLNIYSNANSTLQPGQSIQLISNVKRVGLPVGEYNGQALLLNNSENDSVKIDFKMEVVPFTKMSISVDTLNFGYFKEENRFYIFNQGNTPLSWQSDKNSDNELSVSPDNGVLTPGDSTEITVTINRDNITNYEKTINIIADGDSTATIPLIINHYDEEKWLITGRVIDAEYDRNNDYLFVVTESPNELRRYDMSNSSVETAALPMPPSSISVGLDGTHLVVGHNGRFSYFNSSSMQLIKNYAVTTDVLDIVLAPNNWVYAFPVRDQWERIRCVDLATGVETSNEGGLIRAGTKGKLHPSGKFIYGADNGLSPSDFEKYDIQEGTAKMMYDSPYHGDYPFSGDIWISEDGRRLFARSRYVFNSTENKSSDMTYSGELVGEGSVKTLDHSEDAGKIYAIFSERINWDYVPSNQIRVYGDEFLVFEDTIELPGFIIPDGTDGGKFFRSQGHFGFFNSQGTEFYVLVKAEEGTGSLNEWAIVTVEVK